MEFYDENLKIKDGLAELFQRFGFADDAYTASRFAIRIGKFAIWLPNLPGQLLRR